MCREKSANEGCSILAKGTGSQEIVYTKTVTLYVQGFVQLPNQVFRVFSIPIELKTLRSGYNLGYPFSCGKMQQCFVPDTLIVCIRHAAV